VPVSAYAEWLMARSRTFRDGAVRVQVTTSWLPGRTWFRQWKISRCQRWTASFDRPAHRVSSADFACLRCQCRPPGPSSVRAPPPAATGMAPRGGCGLSTWSHACADLPPGRHFNAGHNSAIRQTGHQPAVAERIEVA
jgi:hypothetical protein